MKVNDLNSFHFLGEGSDDVYVLYAQLYEGMSLKGAPGSFPKPAFLSMPHSGSQCWAENMKGMFYPLQAAAGEYILKIVMIAFLSSKLYIFSCLLYGFIFNT